MEKSIGTVGDAYEILASTMMPHLHMGLRFEPLPVHPNNSKEASTC